MVRYYSSLKKLNLYNNKKITEMCMYMRRLYLRRYMYMTYMYNHNLAISKGTVGKPVAILHRRPHTLQRLTYR